MVGKKIEKSKTMMLNRRALLVWSPPVIVSLVIPQHAVATVVNPKCSVAPPELVVGGEPKCVGSSVAIGSVDLRLIAGDSTPVIIKDIETHTTDPKNEISNIPDMPITLEGPDSVVISWEGPASDDGCLPLETVTITISYCCEGGELQTVTYDLIELLINFFASR